MKNIEKGITLIALVITIIVLLILAGVAIAMLTGDNGIITNAQRSRSNTAYRAADEKMRLAYMAVRTEIAANFANDTSYDATADQFAEKLKDLVQQDCDNASSDNTKWTVTLGEIVKDGDDKPTREILILCDDPAILIGTETTGKPMNDGYVYGKIILEPRTASYYFDFQSKPATPGGSTTNTTNVTP